MSKNKIDSSPNVRETTSDEVPLLKVEGVFKSFSDSGKSIEVLKGLDFEMPSSTHFSIMGQSGSGKSTFLNVICGLDSFDQGDVKWRVENSDGSIELKSIKEFSNNELSKLRGDFFGFIFQSYHLIPELNAMENVLIAARLQGSIKKFHKDRAVELLETVGLTERLHYNVQKLSGGERQRVAIARALMNEPQVILADEPTGNLDEQTAKEVMDLLIKVCKNSRSSLLLVTHNPDFAHIADPNDPDSRFFQQTGQLFDGTFA